MAINHIDTMASGGYDGTMMTGACEDTTSDNYDGSSMKGDGYDRSSAMMADGYNGSSAVASMADGYDGSSAMASMADGYDGYDGSNSNLAICHRGSPSPPPFLSHPTAVESGCAEFGIVNRSTEKKLASSAIFFA